MNSHTCNTCLLEKPVSEFYSYKTKQQSKPYSKCKACFPRNNNYIHKPTGFSKLPEETKQQILSRFSDRNIHLKEIAAEFGIEYGTFCYWARKRLIL